MFKEPFPKHDKGKDPKTDNNANYTTTSYDYTINHISEMDNHVYTIIIKDKTPVSSTWRGKVILQGIGPSSFSFDDKTPKCNVTTRRGKVTLQSVSSKTTTSSSTKNEYDLIDHLGKTHSLISILEILNISPSHKAILDKILREKSIPTDLNMDQFQAMVGYLSTPHCLTFSEADDASPCQTHNAPHHI